MKLGKVGQKINVPIKNGKDIYTIKNARDNWELKRISTVLADDKKHIILTQE